MHALAQFLLAACKDQHWVGSGWLNRTTPILPTRIRNATTAELLAIVIADTDVLVIANARDEIRRRWLDHLRS